MVLKRRIKPPLKGEDGASRRRGQARYAEYHLKCTKANSYNPLLPPLGEVPRSGKGGVVGDFELLPFNEPHPLSQPVRAASSPIGEPRGLGRIRPRFLKTAGACRKTPQSVPMGLPAPPPGSQVQPPLKGEDGATAPEGSGAVRRIPLKMHQGEFVQSLAAPFGGSAAKRQRGCRW